jgi:hypothetical protein
MANRRMALAALVALGVECVALGARAQDVADLPPPSGAADLRSGIEQRRPFWRGNGPPRAFMSASFELGALYLRPTLAVGYGKPHYQWFGAEIYSSPSLGGGRTYAGLRAAWPQLALRAGFRHEYPIDQYFLTPRDSYEREDLELQHNSRSRYGAVEVEANGSIDIPSGEIFGVITGYGLVSVPTGVFVFEEAIKVVVEPPYLWRARLGYLYHLGWLGSMKIGAAVEAIHLVNRDTAVVRAGPAISVALTHHLEVTGGIMVVAYGPDDLGLEGADLGTLSLRYRWATGERWPEFP